ncbi:hypothetical protein VA7868_04615 [Vibrio aerogenes CECT 7868]|uniref:Uncharacterized protein n=1 Tax=Vibrio aerogenes CECT 7868 TaxID=1216006 RepID=A0A1M6FB86_9VIBR|nr:hypothetical protein [Vibrio aerogenes]SHI94911.1 hypothetical protein VA7868_04615 [Vibrio aerogenes CECT 7868]
MFSVQLNENNIVVGVMSFPPQVPNQIAVQEFDDSLLGKQYINGQFTEVSAHDESNPD